jgi:hypothetical protein
MTKYDEKFAEAFDRLTEDELVELMRPIDYEAPRTPQTKSQPSDSVAARIFDCFLAALFGFGLGVAACGMGAWWLL